jgi:hypothetical protein
MERILNFKHWQLFLLIIIPTSYISKSDVLIFIKLFGILISSIWVYSVVVYGNKKIIELNLPKINLKLFSINILLIPILCLFVFLYFYKGYGQSGVLKLIWNIVMFYWLFAILQTILIAAKTLITIELKRKATFSDYFWTYFFMINLFIGIWFIQPKINKLIAKSE